MNAHMAAAALKNPKAKQCGLQRSSSSANTRHAPSRSYDQRTRTRKTHAISRGTEHSRVRVKPAPVAPAMVACPCCHPHLVFFARRSPHDRKHRSPPVSSRWLKGKLLAPRRSFYQPVFRRPKGSGH